MCGNSICQDRRFLAAHDAQARGLLPLPQPRRQHAEGAGAALEARAPGRLPARRRRTPRSPTSRNRSTSSPTTASTCCGAEPRESCASGADAVESRACRNAPRLGRLDTVAAIRSSPLTASVAAFAARRVARVRELCTQGRRRCRRFDRSRRAGLAERQSGPSPQRPSAVRLRGRRCRARAARAGVATERRCMTFDSLGLHEP